MKMIRFLIPCLLAITAIVSSAQISSPGWYSAQNNPEAAALPESSYPAQPAFQFASQSTPLIQPSAPVAETITPQIQALADGLQDNPTNIFNYVHDHIKFVLYYGSRKGAELTLLEKSGNDFDQSALLLALLSAAGYSNNVQYQFGWQTIPYDNPSSNGYDLHHWWQLTLNNTSWTNTVAYISILTMNLRDYPLVYYATDGLNNNFILQRAWVKLTYKGTTYQLDPAFKVSQTVSGISLPSAMGSSTISNDLMSAAGGTDNSTYAQNLNEANMRSKLATYAGNLVNYIQSNSPNASVQQILGGWQIVPANDPIDFTNSTHFSIDTFGGQMPVLTWTYEPTNLMSTLAIQFAGTNYQWFMPQLQGQRLSLTYNSSGNGQLWQNDNLLAQGHVPLTTNTTINYLETHFSYGIANVDDTGTVVYTNCTATTYTAGEDVYFEYISATVQVSRPILSNTTVTVGQESYKAMATVPGTNGWYQTTLTDAGPVELEYEGSYTGHGGAVGAIVQSNSVTFYPSDNVTIAVTHPNGGWNTTNNTFIPNPTNSENMTMTDTYQSTNSNYAILYAFDPDWGWLQQRENQLNIYLQEGLTNGSRQVTCETLNIMGMDWMLQTEDVEQMLAAQLGVLPMYHHRIGRMAQELGRGYYIDVYMQLNGECPSGGWNVVPSNAQSDLSSFFHSALEAGLIEQLQNSNLVAASTVNMLEIANNNGQPIYLANSGNWSTIEDDDLINYSSTVLNAITENYIDNGFDLLIPQNGSNAVSSAANSWNGYAYEARQTFSDGESANIAMVIEGDFYGGYVSDPNSTVNPPYVDDTGDNQPTAFTETTTQNPSSADPVDTADGTFQVENTDLSLGHAEPRGITLSRYYNGTRRSTNPAGMAGGWIHNYCITANNVPAPQACLGSTTPVQAASLLTATAAAIALYNDGTLDPGNWLATALVAKWGIDQITSSGVSVNLGKDTLQFVQQPSGAFVPPANCTASLTQSSGDYVLQMRRGNTFNFSSSGLLNTIVDPYGKSLSLTYNSSNRVSQVTDWKSRYLKFNYNSSGDLTNVADSSGRSVYLWLFDHLQSARRPDLVHRPRTKDHDLRL
jgi:hypothetical protein